MVRFFKSLPTSHQHIVEIVGAPLPVFVAAAAVVDSQIFFSKHFKVNVVGVVVNDRGEVVSVGIVRAAVLAVAAAAAAAAAVRIWRKKMSRSSQSKIFVFIDFLVFFFFFFFVVVVVSFDSFVGKKIDSVVVGVVG